MIKKAFVVYFVILISILNLHAKEYQKDEVKVNDNFYTDIKTDKPITGVVHTIESSYYITVSVEIPVKNGLRHGKTKVYLGKTVIKEIPYKNGVLDGVYKKYSKRGIHREDKIFKSGELIETIYYNENNQAIYEPHGRTDVKYDENKILVYVKNNMPVNGTLEIEYRGYISEKIDYKDGKIHGKYLVLDSSGNIEKESSYIDGKIHGKYLELDNSGNIKKESSYIDGKLDGNTTSYYYNGKIKSTKQYKEGLRHGNFVYYHQNGKVELKMSFKNDLQEGFERSYTENGFMWSECFYIKGEKNGASILFNKKDRKIDTKVHFKNDLFDGVAEYYDNGILYNKRNYIKGLKDGKSYKYYKNGQIESEVNYTHGEKDGKTTFYYDSGEVKSIEQYKEGLRHGNAKYYYNGTLYEKGNYIKGLKDGRWYKYDENGQLKSAINYIHGKKDGKKIHYDKNGDIVSIAVKAVIGKNVLALNTTKVKYIVELNIENPTEDEIKALKVEIEEKDETGKVTIKQAKVKYDLTIDHNLQDESKLVEVKVKVYPIDYPDNSAQIISYIRPIKEDDKMVNVRASSKNDEYINSISDEIYILRADTSLEDATAVTAILKVIGKDDSILVKVEKETYVKNHKIEEEFDIYKIIKDNKLDEHKIKLFEGEINYTETNF